MELQLILSVTLSSYLMTTYDFPCRQLYLLTCKLSIQKVSINWQRSINVILLVESFWLLLMQISTNSNILNFLKSTSFFVFLESWKGCSKLPVRLWLNFCGYVLISCLLQSPSFLQNCLYSRTKSCRILNIALSFTKNNHNKRQER